jgi:hypothetical protein
MSLTTSSAYEVSPEQQLSFQDSGYLILRDVLSPAETRELQQWAQQVHDLPSTPDTPWMPYEEVNGFGRRVLCRTENYANYHSGFNSLLRGNKLLGMLAQLTGEDMLLFKEKARASHDLVSKGLTTDRSTINSPALEVLRLIWTVRRIHT